MTTTDEAAALEVTPTLLLCRMRDQINELTTERDRLLASQERAIAKAVERERARCADYLASVAAGFRAAAKEQRSRAGSLTGGVEHAAILIRNLKGNEHG